MERELRPIVSKLKEVQQKIAGVASRSPELAMVAGGLEGIIESLRTGRDPHGQPTDLKEVVAALTFPAKMLESLGMLDTVAQLVFVQRQLLDLVEARKAPRARPSPAPAPELPRQEAPPVLELARRAELAARLRSIRDSLGDRASRSSDVATVMTILERLGDALETGRAPNGSAVRVADIPAGLKVPIVVLENQQMASQVGALQVLQRDIAELAERLRVAPPPMPERPPARKQPVSTEQTSTAETVVGVLATVVFAVLGTAFLQVIGAQVIGFPEGVAWFGAVVLAAFFGMLVAVVAMNSVPGLFRRGSTFGAAAGLLLVVVPWVAAGIWGAQRLLDPLPKPARAAVASSTASPVEPVAAEPARRPETTAVVAQPTATPPTQPTATVPPATGDLSDEVARRLAYGDLDGAVDLLRTLRSSERQGEDAQRSAVTVVAALRAESRGLEARDGDGTVAAALAVTADELERRFELEPPAQSDSGRQQDFPSSQPDRWRALEGQLVLVVPTVGAPYEARLLRIEAAELDLEVVSAVGGGEVTMARSVPIARVRSLRHPVLRKVLPTPTPRWGGV